MILRDVVQDLKHLNALLAENPALLHNIEIVYFSAVILVTEGQEEKKKTFHKQSFSVTTTFHLAFESQVEAFLCQQYKVIKFVKPVKLHGSKKL